MCDQLGPKPRAPKISKKANSNAVTASQASMPHSGTKAQPIDLNGLSSSTDSTYKINVSGIPGKEPTFPASAAVRCFFCGRGTCNRSHIDGRYEG